MAMRIQPLFLVWLAVVLHSCAAWYEAMSDRVGIPLESGETVAISSAHNTPHGSGAVERVLANTTDRMAALHLHRRVCYGGRAVRCQLDPWIQPVRLLVKLPRGLQWWQWTDLSVGSVGRVGSFGCILRYRHGSMLHGMVQ